jgi:hypothetical protein
LKPTVAVFVLVGKLIVKVRWVVVVEAIAHSTVFFSITSEPEFEAVPAAKAGLNVEPASTSEIVAAITVVIFFNMVAYPTLDVGIL